jgi:hypothetical protein
MVAQDALRGELSEEFRDVVMDYLERCKRKLGVREGA